MSKLLQKLSSKSGETLVETLFAIMIFTLASVAMYSMVTCALSISERVKAADMANQSQMIVAERAEGEGKSASITIKLNDTPVGISGQEMDEVPVNIYGGEDGELYAYYVDGSAPSKGGNG